MNDETRAVVEAVLDALDIPHAATAGDEEKRRNILANRLTITTVTLRSLLDLADTCSDELRLRVFRDLLAEHPAVGYVTHEQLRERLAQGMTWPEAIAAAQGEPSTPACPGGDDQ